MDANEVVISGIGAHFPQCFDVGQFGKNILANKHLPGPTDRWKYDSKLNVDPVCGEISFNCFDDTFFGINKRLALMMDPVAKVGYLRSFEAIIDAGLHPSSVRGHNVGVYAGCGINEYEQVMTADLSASSSVSNSEGYVVMGISRSMFPNRISYYFDLTGPSVAIDSSWAMAHLGLQQAADAISKGSCEAALVIAAAISNYPHTASLLKQLGMISDDCITRSFDKDGSGSVRSDCVVAFFLQRADAAKRCYARVLASDIKYTGDHFYVNITLPHPRGLESFLTNMYRTNGIDPARISYLEADGIGNPLRDECELNAIDKVLAQARREKPLLIGSVKSNAGNTDCVSGFVAICKVIVAMETGTIPATLNFHSPSEEVPGLLEGRMKILTSNEPVELKEDSVFAVNTLSMSSMVGHTVLQPNPRASESQEPSAHLPRLITLSGRTEEGLIEVVKKIQSMPFDTNFYRLVQDAFSPDIKGYQFRSFVICPDENQTPIVHRMEKRSTWFLYSGMGSQWAGMAAGLMVLPIFAETIERLHAVLLPKGLDLKTIITETSHEAFNNILKSFVGISACQIALTNVLTAVGLVPDGIIGHSVGELGCAYADGCLTEEQTILAAWARGVASNEATLIKGMMAAIGLGYKDVLPRLPPTIDVACHNSDSSCTLSGPAQDVRSFVEQLSSEGVFAKAVNVSDIAYHSRYIQPAAPFLRKYLQEVIPEPKRRSSRWISTSVPMDKWDSAVFCSAEYQTNNLLSPVLFEEGLAHVPKQSILIEVAPHGLMQAILKRALPDPIHIPLAQRGHADSLRFLLAAIGRTSFGMAAPKVSALYPDVQLPVPRGTATLAGLVTWQADESADPFKTSVEDEIVPSISLHMDSPVFEVDGSRIFPLSEQLVIMWTLAAAKAEISMSSCPVALRHVLVSSWQVVPKEGTNKVNALYMSGTKKVELLTTRDSEKHLLVHAFAREITKYDDVPPPLPVIDMTKHNPNILEKEDLYRNLSLNGLRYPQRFHNISSLEMGETDWIIKVSNEADSWANILESVVQVFLLKAMNENQALCLPRSIQHLDVDPTKISKQRELTLRLHLPTGVLQGPGLYAAGFAMAEAPAAPRNTSALQFVPVGGASAKSLDEFLRLVVSLVLEPGKQDIAVIAIPNGQTTSELSKAVTAAIHASTGVIARTVTVTPEGTQPAGFKDSVPLLVTGPDTVTEAACALAVGVTGAILVWSRERLSGPGGAAASGDMAVLAEWGAERQWVTLLRRRAPLAEPETVVLKMEGRDAVVPSTLPANKTVVLVWQGVSEDDVVATLNIVDARPDLGKARLVFILDDTAPAFSLRHPVYAEQLAMDVRVNILAKGRVWGSQSTLAKLPTKTVKATFSASRLDGVKLEYFGANPLGLSGQAGLSGHVDYVGVLEDNNKTTKVMGVGQWLSDCQRPRLDPLLHWPVPKGWSSADAATVPFVYAVVYLALKVKAEARKGESILVHEGASALGQAAIRVAKQLGCSPIYTTVRNDEQRRLLAQTFPELDNANVLICGDGGSFEYRLRTLTRGRGVRLVVNTLPDTELRASMRCLGFWGRLLHFKRDDMLAARSIGSHIFLTSVSVFGFSGNELFLAHDRDRTEVALAMRQGLQDGTVKPIVGATTFSDVHEVLSSEEFTKAIIKVKETSQAGSSQQCDPNKCYIVVGNQTGAALFVAGKLSVLGARHIVAAVGSPPSSAVVRQQQRTLRRQHGTSLYVHQVQSWTMSAASAVLKAATALAPVHSTVVVVKDDGDVAVPALLSTALSALDNQDEAMVLLSEHTGAVTSLTALVEQRKAQQRRTACMFAPLAEAVRHLEELLCAPPTVTMLPSANAIARVAESHPAECVPHTPASLCALGHAVSRLRRGLQGQDKGPWLRELSSLGPRGRFNRENFPLYAMAPLGVLDADSREQLVGVASKMHSSVFVVETVPDAACSLKDTAAAVVQAILSRQPFGPYNLMGWRLGTVLALEVQRQLEAAGKLGVLFLVHGDVRLVRQWALQQVASPTRHTDPSSQGGAQVVDALAVCLAEHESNVDDAFSWRVHVIRSTVDEQLSFAGDDLNVSLMTVTSTSLNDSAFVHLFNSSGAWSHLAGTNDLRLAINRSDRSDSC